MKSRKPGDPMAPRAVHSLSLATNFSIQPEQWVGIAGRKEFDEKNTAILRVFSHRDGYGRWMVYGMRAHKENDQKHATKAVETYEFVATAELLAAAINKVAQHCGIEALAADVVKALP
jgi:hypothetical protein